jgi:hypothetical protein
MRKVRGEKGRDEEKRREGRGRDETFCFGPQQSRCLPPLF